MTTDDLLLKILYVEDDLEIARAMMRFFSMVEVKATHFTSVKEAVEAMRVGTFDLVLTDWNLKGEIGLGVVEAARALNLPVRVYSGNEWDSKLDPSLKDIWLIKRGNKPVEEFIAEVRGW